jgi:hypothetical protein
MIREGAVTQEQTARPRATTTPGRKGQGGEGLSKGYGGSGGSGLALPDQKRNLGRTRAWIRIEEQVIASLTSGS